MPNTNSIDLPRITLTSPIRNKDFIISLFLKHIYEIDYPKELLTLLFVVNNSSDNSLNILQQFKKEHSQEYARIRIEECNSLSIPDDKRDQHTRMNYTYQHLSNIRNHIISLIKTPFQLSIDCDILCPSDIIHKLLSHHVDVVSSLIYNGYEFSPKTPYLYTNAMIKDETNQFKHLSRIHIKDIVSKGESLLQEIDLTGAIVLISQKVLKNKNIRYHHHQTGEDASWSESIKKEGIKMYVDLNCYSQHIMNPKCLELYLKGELI